MEPNPYAAPRSIPVARRVPPFLLGLAASLILAGSIIIARSVSVPGWGTLSIFYIDWFLAGLGCVVLGSLIGVGLLAMSVHRY
jgi:hypothetical protein